MFDDIIPRTVTSDDLAALFTSTASLQGNPPGNRFPTPRMFPNFIPNEPADQLKFSSSAPRKSTIYKILNRVGQVIATTSTLPPPVTRTVRFPTNLPSVRTHRQKPSSTTSAAIRHNQTAPRMTTRLPPPSYCNLTNAYALTTPTTRYILASNPDCRTRTTTATRATEQPSCTQVIDSGAEDLIDNDSYRLLIFWHTKSKS